MEQELEESENTSARLRASLNEAKSRIKELEEQAENFSGIDVGMDELQSEKEELEFKIQSIRKEYDLKIETLSNQLQDKTQSLRLAEDRLKSTSDHSGAMSDTLDEKNREIDHLNSIIEEKNKEITDLNDIISEKNSLIERISADLKVKREESISLLKKVKERDKRIEDLQARPPAPPVKIPAAPVSTLVTPMAPTPTPATRPSAPIARAPTPAAPTTTYTRPSPGAAPKIRHSAPLVGTPTITADLEWKDSGERMKVLTVAGDVIKETENLSAEEVGIIIDKPNGVIWVWKGSKASRLNAIRASTKAPSIRSGYRLYDWKVEFIDQGEEPEIFPFNVISS